MSAKEIDDVFALQAEPKRSTLEEMRRRILDIVPDAEQLISYGMPSFKINGRVFASVAPFKNHLNYSPHSSQIFVQIPELLTAYKYSPGSLQFAIDEPLPRELIKVLIDLRLKLVDEQNAAAATKRKR